MYSMYIISECTVFEPNVLYVYMIFDTNGFCFESLELTDKNISV